jgi:hypothetical protein
MYMLLQDSARYLHYVAFSNHLWTQLPPARRTGLRFVFLLGGVLAHIYGASDPRLQLVLDSVHEAPEG